MFDYQQLNLGLKYAPWEKDLKFEWSRYYD